MSRRARDIRDRFLQSGGDRLIRRVKNASRRVGEAAVTRGGRRTAKPGVDLHFRGLEEPAGELEAVLDDLDATSDPIFSTAVDKNEQAQQQHQRPTAKRGGGMRPREPPRPSYKTDDDPLFPSDGEDSAHSAADGGGGERRLPRQATGPTDSEESEDLELDEAVAAEVLESLHLLAGKMDPEDLFDSESPPSYTAGENVGRGGRDGAIERALAVNNESANNNTHFQEAGEILPATTTETLSSGSIPNRDDPVGSHVVPPPQHYEPSLEELLEHGSAALPYRSYSSSPHRPHGSPRAADTDSSPSPLTSSNETDLTHLTGRSQTLRPTTSHSSSDRQPPVKHFGFDGKSPDSAEKKGVAQEQAETEDDSLFSEPHPTSRSPVKEDGRDTSVSLTPSGGHPLNSSGVKGAEEEGEVSGKKCPRDDSDELFPDDSKLLDDSKVTETVKGPVEDDLFPDDTKLLKHSQKQKKSSVGANSDDNSLEIREDHFSPSPEEQRKNRAPLPPSRPSPPAASSLQSTGKPTVTGKKVAPPRPPRSPRLDSRLKLRQQQQEKQKGHSTTITSGTSHTPPPSRRLFPTRGSPEVARVRDVRALSSSPPSTRRTTTEETDTSQPNSRASQAKAASEARPTPQPSLVPHSSQPSPETQPPSTTTLRTESVSDESEIDLELPFLPLHVHLSLSLLLYFYYTLNPFPYLAGLAAGFLLFYLCLGAAFVAYVRREEEEMGEGSKTPGPVDRELSIEFMKSTSIRLEDYESRFIAPSSKHKFEFTATLQYDFATHHRRDRQHCRLKLINDFDLFIHIHDSEGDTIVKKSFNLCKEKAQITIVPEDVFQNRKRRWSKKYPIRLVVGGCEYFLFSNVSRFKQEWFFRLREAAGGTTTQQLVKRKQEFFRYMLRYFSSDPSQRNSASLPPTSSMMSSSSVGSHSMAAGPRSSRHHPQRRHKIEEGAVQFSSSAALEEDITEGSVSISNSSSSSQPQHASIASTVSSSSSVNDYSLRPSSARSLSNTSSMGAVSPLPSTGGPSSLEGYWINAVSARIFWDVWHEERWKQWIVSRIERKLVRIKTPRFLDPLQLTDIAIGESMPVINRLYDGPYLRVDGVWLFFDVEYEGEFVMTIKTRLKLGHWRKGKEEKGTEMKAMKHQSRVSHSQAAVMLQKSSGVYPDEDDSETGSEEEEEEEEGRHTLSNPLGEEEEEEGEGEGEEKLPTVASSPSSEPQPPVPHHQRKKRGAKLRKVMSNITKRVANNRLVRRAAERAVEKASNVPLELTVEVKKLKGVVAINIPPPSSDTIWYGFRNTPKLELVARPKLGKRAVTFSQITHWIERKLCSLVDEKLTLPNMEDLVVPVLNSGLPEDTQKPLS